MRATQTLQPFYKDLCSQCEASDHMICSGIRPSEQEGKWEQCDKLKAQTVTSLTGKSGLTRLIDSPPVVDIPPPVTGFVWVALSIPPVDVLDLLGWMVSEYIRKGRTAQLFNLPAWVGKSDYSILQADHLAPTFAAYALPDLMLCSDKFQDYVFQRILGRLDLGLTTVVGTVGEWNGYTDIGSLVVYKLHSEGTVIHELQS